MKYEELIKEFYYATGKLEGIFTYLHRYVPDQTVVMELRDCVDRLDLVGAQLMGYGDPVIVVKDPPITEEQLEDLKKKKVIFHEERPEEAFGRVYPPQEDAGD